MKKLTVVFSIALLCISILASEESNVVATKVKKFTEEEAVCFDTIERNALLLKYCCELCKANRYLVSKAVVRNPLSLLFSNEKFKNDLLLIMSALTNSEEPQPFPIFKASNYASATEIYGWISDEMKITPCVYHKLISFDIRALEYFPTRIMNDKELFRLYLSLDQNLQHSPSYSSTNIPSSSYLQYFSEEITGNKDFMTEIILDYPIVLCHIRKLASDMDFLKQLFIHRATKTETLTKNVAKLQLVKANGYVTSLSSELQQNQQMVEKLRQLNHCIDASIRELMRI
jgi:hypothetical protein